jgi:hypothetical protein
VAAGLSSFLKAVADNVPEAEPDTDIAPSSCEIWEVKSRLASTFAYLSYGLSISARDLPPKSALPISPFLRIWEEVLQVIENFGGLPQAVRTIESRVLLACWSRSSKLIQGSSRRRLLIEWTHLAECAAAGAAAGTPAVHRRKDGDETGQPDLGESVKSAMASIQQCELTSDVRAALELQVSSAWQGNLHSPEKAVAEIETAAQLARELRQLRGPGWMPSALSDVAEIVSLIGCGVVLPWGPCAIPSWHIRCRDLDRVLERLAMIPGSISDVVPSVGYVMQHAAVFDARAQLCDWLQLPKAVAAGRIRCLMPDWATVYQSRGQAQAAAQHPRMPFGFSYFLVDPHVRRFALYENPAIAHSYLVTPHEDILFEALVRAWETARENVETLKGWAGACAQAAQFILRNCPTGNPVASREATEANVLMRLHSPRRPVVI